MVVCLLDLWKRLLLKLSWNALVGYTLPDSYMPTVRAQSRILKKLSATNVSSYVQELQRGNYMKFTDPVRFLENMVKYRIDRTVLYRHLKYIAECGIPCSQESMLLVKQLQKITKSRTCYVLGNGD